VHIPGLDLHVGGHEIGPVHVDVGGDVGHPEPRSTCPPSCPLSWAPL
jgi:hypothetical protein